MALAMVCTLSTCGMGLNRDRAQARAEMGVLAPGRDLINQVVRFDGDWDLYWLQLLTPEEFEDSSPAGRTAAALLLFAPGSFAIKSAASPKTVLVSWAGTRSSHTSW